MNTFYQLWGVTNPNDAKAIIDEQIKSCGISNPKNLEEQALCLVGKDIFNLLIKDYTEKQWGRPCKELPPFIIKRLPIRFTYDNNYFNDIYQGIPIGGYTALIKKLLKDVETRLNIDFIKYYSEYKNVAKKIVYTGKIDEFFNYDSGYLAYRSLKFETEKLETNNFQGNAVINYMSSKVPYTRIIEHKHFEFGNQAHTIITKEFPQEWNVQNEAYYPINDEINEKLATEYKKRALQIPNLIFGGRLAEYKYYDMHQIIAQALKAAKKEQENV